MHISSNPTGNDRSLCGHSKLRKYDIFLPRAQLALARGMQVQVANEVILTSLMVLPNFPKQKNLSELNQFAFFCIYLQTPLAHPWGTE
jgi:hypothetical protein